MKTKRSCNVDKTISKMKDKKTTLVTIESVNKRITRSQNKLATTRTFEVSNKQMTYQENKYKNDTGVRISRACETKELKSLSKQVSSFHEKLFKVLFLFLMDIKDVPEWHYVVKEEDHDAGNGDLYDAGLKSMDRIARVLGGEIVLPIVAKCLGNCRDSSNWKGCQGILICLSQIAEGCANVMGKEVDHWFEVCVNALNGSLIKVKWAACDAIWQFFVDLSSKIRESNYQEVVKALVDAMMDERNPRVQAHASNAIINFVHECEEEHSESHLHAFVSICLNLMEADSLLVVEASLTTLSLIADRINVGFKIHYKEVMQRLKFVFAHASEKDLYLIRAKSLECISIIGASVGKETFYEMPLT